MFIGQHLFECLLKLAVFAEQIVQVAVQKPVAPHQLKQGMQEKPSVFQVFDVFRSGKQGLQVVLVLAKQVVDDIFLARVVVIQIAWADPKVGSHHGGCHIGLAKAVEKAQSAGHNALGGLTRRFADHGLSAL